MKNFKTIIIGLLAAFLAACGGGGGSGSGGGGGSGPTPPTPSVSATGVSIGNVATIPVGSGSNRTSAIVSNNFPNQLVLKSASYIVYESSGTSKPKDATQVGSLVNASLCQTVQANGTCSIFLDIPAKATQGQYLVTLDFINTGDQKTYSTSQLISYSTAVSVNNTTGVQVSPINNTLYNIPNGLNSYSVPFILTQSVTNLSAVSDHNNPAFSPTISCEGSAPYPAGTACTLFIRISQTGSAQLISGNVTVSTNNASSSAQTKSKATGIKGTTGYLFNVPVTVIQNNTGNLVTSAVNVIVNPADGTSPQTITLFNNGANSITGINLIGTGPTVIGSNTCTGTLGAGSACTFTVNGTVTQNSQGAVIVNYSSNGNNNSLAFNIIYIIPNSTAGLSLTASSTSLLNTVESTTNSISINVKNTGQADFTNLSFTSIDLLNPAFSYTNTGSCATDGSQALPVGQSCTLVVNYSPTTIESGTIIIRGTANYTSGSLSGSYESATATISYSSISGNAFVYITPNYVAYAIRADNTDTAAQTFVIVNAGPISTTVNPESLANPPVTAYASTGGTCSFPQTLGAAGSGTESCTINAQFGPISTVMNNTTAQMTATYLTSGTTTAATFANLSFTSSNAALVSIASVVESGSTSGSGVSGDAYLFTNSPANSGIQFTITYQNTGTESALNFSVALNNLPVGYYPTGGTCNSGVNGVSTLLIGGSCTTTFAAESTGLPNSYSLNGDLSFNLPGWSYTDSTGLNTNSAPTYISYPGGTVYVTSNPLSTATESAASNFTGATTGSTGVNSLTFNGTPDGTIITIQRTSDLSSNITFGNSGTCTISSSTCSIPVDNALGLPVTTYHFFYLVSPSGFATEGIMKSGQFTYIN